MPNKKTTKKNWWNRLKNFTRTHTNLTVIISAAFLLELTTAVMYYSAQNIIQKTMERLVNREMNAIYLCIRNKLTKVEVTIDNMAWMVSGDLENPNWMFGTTRRLLENNPSFLGSSISFIPYYYPEKGRWFEPFSIRRADGTIETMQLASATHDYTKKKFFTEPLANNSGYWCEPYLDPDGAKEMVISYGAPVHDNQGRSVAVVVADLSLYWLGGVMEESKLYKSTQRFLVTGSGHKLAGKENATFHTALQYLKNDVDKEGYFTMKDEYGEKLHVFFHPVDGVTGWVLINVLNDNDVFGRLRQVRLMLAMLVIAGLLLLGFIVWRTSRNLDRLRIVNAEKNRIDGELQVANRIQQSMLPQNHQQTDDVEIYGSLVPAREVGGDLFDYFFRDEKLFFCIGDVSGKGPASAMLMGVTHALFRSASAHENNPARIMRAINEPSCQGNNSNMFVTLFIGVLDLPTGRLRYCNAGHDVPLLIHNSQFIVFDAIPHLPIGVFDDIKYGAQELLLPSGSIFFLYTDGLTEAMNKEHKQFGMERVRNELASCSAQRPRDVLETIMQKVHEFVKDAEQSDDLTMLVIRYTPQSFESVFTDTLVLKNDIREIGKLGDFQKSVYTKINLDTSLINKLRLAVEEAVVNVIDYAYPIGKEGEITIRMMYNGQRLKILIIDAGVPFDPTAKERVDTTLSAEERQIGGLGILLVRELMDTINYEREEGKNILTLIKDLK